MFNLGKLLFIFSQNNMVLKHKFISFLVLLFAVLASSCSALYSPSSDVVDLNPNNFDRLVINSDEVWIVEFFAPWCGHCQQFVPEYQKAAKALKVSVGILAVYIFSNRATMDHNTCRKNHGKPF